MKIMWRRAHLSGNAKIITSWIKLVCHTEKFACDVFEMKRNIQNKEKKVICIKLNARTNKMLLFTHPIHEQLLAKIHLSMIRATNNDLKINASTVTVGAT